MVSERVELRPTQERSSPDRITLLIQEFEAALPNRLPERAESTRSCYVSDVNKFCRFLKQRDVNALGIVSPELAQSYLDLHSNATANRRRVALNHFFEWAISTGLVKSNPVETIDPINHKCNEPLKYLSGNHVFDLLSETQNNPKLNRFILISLATGAHITEILNLKRSDIMVRKNKMVVDFQRAQREFAPEKQHLEQISTHLIGLPKEALLFPSRIKPEEPMTRAGVHLYLSKAGKHIGIYGLNNTVLINTFAANFKGDADALAKARGIHTADAERQLLRLVPAA